jgi:hypothetical protein
MTTPIQGGLMSTTIQTEIYRSIEIQFWESDRRWFAFSTGQDCDDNGCPSLSEALARSKDFIDKSAGKAAAAGL